MIKLISPHHYDFGEPSTALVDLHSRGVDGDWLIKRAAAGVFADSNLKAKPNHSLIHLIAMGDTEIFGPNRNGDAFYGGPRKLDLPEPDWETVKTAGGFDADDNVIPSVIHKKSPETFTSQTAVGNRERAYTFQKYAHVFRNHLNKPKDGHKIHGEVPAAVHNGSMHRVELMIEVPHGPVWDDDLEKIANDKPVYFSMSCVGDPSYPVLTIDGYKPISEITTEDKVLTHTGKWKRVKALNRRVYSGEMVTVAVNGLPLPLYLTADHPMWAKVFDPVKQEYNLAFKVKRYFKNAQEFEKQPAGWAHASHLKKGDRLFYQPVPIYPGRSAIDCKDLATLMGYYLAEGSFLYNGSQVSTTCLTVNVLDSAVERVPEIMERLYPNITCKLRPHSNSNKCLSLEMFHSKLAEFFKQKVGRYSSKKFICPEIFNADREIKLAFLGAWMDGDGFMDSKGGHWSTCNRNLAMQGRDLLASIGISSAICHIDHTTQPKTGMGKLGQEWTLNVSTCDLHHLDPYSQKASRHPKKRTQKRAPTLRPCHDGRYSYRIKSVDRSEVQNLQTYNIEVEDDESYLLAGCISHNCRVPHEVCSVCGHKSRTLDERCPHLSNQLTQILKSGNTVSAVNDWMTYFDISRVVKPADRIAWALTKAAQDQAIDLSEIERDMPLEVRCEGEPEQVARRIRLASKAAEIEKRLPLQASISSSLARSVMRRKPVEKLASLRGYQGQSIPATLRVLGDGAIYLRFNEFAQLILGEKSAAKLPDPPLSGLLAAAAGDEAVLANTSYDVEPVSPPSHLKRAALAMHSASLLPEDVAARAVSSAAAGEPIPAMSPQTVKLAGLSREYAAYTLSFLDHVTGGNDQRLEHYASAIAAELSVRTGSGSQK